MDEQRTPVSSAVISERFLKDSEERYSPRAEDTTCVSQRPVKIALRKVSKEFRTADRGTFVALREIEAEIGDGEFVALIGPSGGGKTTLLNVVAGLTPPTGGQVLVDGRPVRRPGPDRGVVFQQDALFMWRRVIKNVEYGLEIRNVPKDQRQQTAMDYLRMVGLEKFADFYPKQLSGGMKKRVQIATVFANNPEVLLMDEPFGALDYPTKVDLQEQLLTLWARDAKTSLFVTHDMEEALFLADRVFVLVDGKLETILNVPFGRPRAHDLRMSQDFHALKLQLWNYMR